MRIWVASRFLPEMHRYRSEMYKLDTIPFENEYSFEISSSYRFEYTRYKYKDFRSLPHLVRNNLFPNGKEVSFNSMFITSTTPTEGLVVLPGMILCTTSVSYPIFRFVGATLSLDGRKVFVISNSIVHHMVEYVGTERTQKLISYICKIVDKQGYEIKAIECLSDLIGVSPFPRTFTERTEHASLFLDQMQI